MKRETEITQPLLSASGLSWTPPNAEKPLLMDVALHLDAGEILGITGKSGCGKSSLLRCLVRLEPASGELRWKGTQVDSGNVRDFRRSVGYVQQSPVALSDTVGDNLAFAQEMGGEKALDLDAQRALLDRLGLGGLKQGRKFSSLSLGEKQRLALVRSLTPQPDVLLLDEPTSALDPDSVQRSEEVLRQHLLEPGRAIILVSHQPEQLDRLCSRRMALGG
jgi:putative ABC transport system ATP-binding protein